LKEYKQKACDEAECIVETLENKFNIKKYFVEKKYNGFRAVIHKKGSEVKIFSDQANDITFAFPTVVGQSQKLSSSDYVLDCELVPYKNDKPLGRDVASAYISSVKSQNKIDDKGVIFFAFDCLYFDTDLTNEPLYQRKKVLHRLNFTENIREVASVLVDNVKDATKAINMFKDLDGSEGAVVKRYDGKYSVGKESADWIKFRSLLIHNFIVVKKNTAGNEYNYTLGVVVSDADIPRLNSKYVSKVNDLNILVLGNSFNTSISVSVGDIIEIGAEEFWRHKSKSGFRFSIHKPHVIKKTIGSTATIKEIDADVVARGVEVTENELTDETLEEVNNFPDRMKEHFNNVMESGKPEKYVMQWHYRGHVITDEERNKENINEKYLYSMESIHTDLRMSVGASLEGLTLLTPGTSDVSVQDKMAQQSIHNVRAILKAPQPTQWLEVSEYMPKGEPGTTEKAPAYFVIIGKGTYMPKIVEDHRIIVEFNSESGDIVFGNPEKDKLYITRKPGSKLRQMPKYLRFQIAHIKDKHIILVNEGDEPEQQKT